MKNCPVCGKTELPDISTKCPQCNADLTCFAMIDALCNNNFSLEEIKEVQNSLQRIQEKFEKPVKITRNRLVISIFIAMMCMGSLLFYHYFFMKKWVDSVMTSVEQRNQMYDKMYRSTTEQLSKTSDELAKVSKQLSILEKELSVLSTEKSQKQEQDESTKTPQNVEQNIQK